MQALVPMYLQLNGISPAQRLLNNLTIAAAFFLSPKWSAMPHNLSSLIMWLALLTGEVVGAHMSSLFLRWIQTPSALRGLATPMAPRVARNGASPALKRVPIVAERGCASHHMKGGTTGGEPGLAGPGVNGTAESSPDSKGPPIEPPNDIPNEPPSEPQPEPPDDPAKPQPVKVMLRCFACQVDFHPDVLRMLWPTLCFEDPTLETLYAANSLVHSRGMHSIATAAVCATGIFLSPGFRPLGLLAGLWTILIWRTHRRVQSWRDSPLAYIRFCEAYSRFSFFFGAVLLSLSLVATKTGHEANTNAGRDSAALRSPASHATRADAGEAGSPRLLSSGSNEVASPSFLLSSLGLSLSSPPFLRGIGLTLRGTSDPIGVVCSCLLLVLAGAHHRLVVLAPAQRMTNRVIVLVGVFASHSEEESEQLLPSAAHSFILAVCVLLMGELIGFSIDHVRRSLFRDWVLELYAAHRASLQAAADLERMAANAQDLERKNASNMAEMAADKRLNHGELSIRTGRFGVAVAIPLTPTVFSPAAAQSSSAGAARQSSVCKPA
jgi:hypothetical protein